MVRKICELYSIRCRDLEEQPWGLVCYVHNIYPYELYLMSSKSMSVIMVLCTSLRVRRACG